MQLTALILAGGRSQRMGQDKALLAIAGVPLLRKTWEVAHSLTPQVSVVTPRRDRYQSLLPSEAQWIEEETSQPPAGPLLAFYQALLSVTARGESHWILLLACDLPNLQVAPLQQWAQELPNLPTPAIAYVPKAINGWEPLCGFYRLACLASLENYLATGRRSFQGWLDQSEVIAIPDVPINLLVNCNTPEDWQHFKAHFSQNS